MTRVQQNIVAGFFITALLVFLLPAVCTPGHGGAMSTHCLSNLKQLALGTIMYATDWHERMPHRDAWMDLIQPYLMNSAIEKCPAIEAEFDDQTQLYGYAFNGHLSQVDSSKVPKPEDVPLEYDSINLARHASDLVTSLPDPPRQHGSRRRNQMAYLDGHAKGLIPELEKRR